jgi:SOS response regulatory protein OraA/RecX
MAMAALQRRWARWPQAQRERRAIALLQRRGFRTETIRWALRRLAAEQEGTGSG